MIKFLGKVRYHWQPELSWSIIYWSIALLPVFISLALVYENTKMPSLVFVFAGIFIALFALGMNRYFLIKDNGLLVITSANIFHPKKIEIKTIKKIEVTRSSICIFTDKWKKGKVYYMRKWPKKYFINALVLSPSFKGEVELTEHLIELDYFELYYGKSKKS